MGDSNVEVSSNIEKSGLWQDGVEIIAFNQVFIKILIPTLQLLCL